MRLFALLMFSVSFAVRAEAQVTLQFKLAEGDVIRQVMTQEMTSASKVQGRDVSSEMKQIVHIEQQIGEVAENGSAQVLQKITRMQMSMKMPFGQSFEYDSDGENDQVPAMFKDLIGKMVGAEFKGTLAPTGEMTDISISEDLRNALKKSPGSPFGAGKDDDVFQQMMSQSSVAFPDHPVKEGDSWSDEITMKMPFGEMKVDRTSTYNGTDDDGLHVIDISLEMTLQPGDNPQMKLSIKDSTASGKMLFDNAAGRIVNLDLKQNVTMEISAAGQQINQEVSTTTKLEADKGERTTQPSE
ncbi:MAG: hypothetical protein KDA86_20900 [Planctomycetaceae bacterium]|nr:hypothetical protein [Planctomycetaceae bacterium]